MAVKVDTSRWSDVETMDRTTDALQKAGDDLSTVLLLLRALEARGMTDAGGILGPLQALVSNLDEIELFIARHGGIARPRAAGDATLLERLAAFGMSAEAIPAVGPSAEYLGRAVNDGPVSLTPGKTDLSAAALNVREALLAEERIRLANELIAAGGARRRAAEGTSSELGGSPNRRQRTSSFAPPSPAASGSASGAITDASSLSMSPTSDPRAPLVTSLRNVVAFALGGAVIAGMLLGHQLAGVDPRYGGAAVGGVVGLLVWAVRGV